MQNANTDFITVVRDGAGWRLQDAKGHLHSTRIRDKARAQRQANAMNVKLARVAANRTKKDDDGSH